MSCRFCDDLKSFKEGKKYNKTKTHQPLYDVKDINNITSVYPSRDIIYEQDAAFLSCHASTLHTLHGRELHMTEKIVRVHLYIANYGSPYLPSNTNNTPSPLSLF